ncbi:hypothetical protein FNF29_01735 [Cafeteria roenbergensis]|uniref:glutamate synthase (ferredoxin) n=1 Tax=Cafeteria roenbergensis TaxID=33653 RepID=A0A5A8CT47_CAFRO|nr:hypothetical protein FNF29_01735 [Cafeteria roenbergensis]|eukprot:KAA0155360.1 hypothetical protein FNF29_01735 [Cafeteria roenbergensis]
MLSSSAAAAARRTARRSTAQRTAAASAGRGFMTVNPDGSRTPAFLPRKTGLYDPAKERDACGVGFIADLNGTPTHTTVHEALEAVRRLDHRGAAAADSLTGDGVGVMTQIPRLFFRKALSAAGVDMAAISMPHDEPIAIGMLMLPGHSARLSEPERLELRQLCESVVTQLGVEVLAWREVPMGTYALGKAAALSRPDMQQLVMRAPVPLREALSGSLGPAARNTAHETFERLLYLARRTMERKFSEASRDAVADGRAPLDFYAASFSSRTIVYKGLVVAPNVRNLFPDLNDSDFQSALALFHQRYSTNTMPMWYTAQPFRMLAHNGEINTLQGNINWMRMREESLRSDVFGSRFSDLTPVIQEGGSDSAALDNVMELLVQCGRSPANAAAMLVPEAFENHKEMDPRVRAFFEYQRTLMEPWDGPAALCFTDGRVAAASLDRNGLRPLRYWLTSSNKLIVGSEVGIVSVPTEMVVERGRLGAGEMLVADVETGVLLRNQDVKTQLATARPYSAWLERSVRHLTGGRKGLGQILSTETLMRVISPVRAKQQLEAAAEAQAAEEAKAAAEAAAKEEAEAAAAAAAAGEEPPKPRRRRVPRAKALAPEDLPAPLLQELEDRARLKRAFGWSREDETLIVRAAAATAHEPIGSMGDDTPLAALSSKPQQAYRYLKQRFAEVTNPPIDPLLERSTMSLSITFGRKGMLLEETQFASFLVRLPSPVVTEAQLAWLVGHREFASETLSATFDANAGPGGLRDGVRELCRAAEAAVDSGVSYILLSDRNVSAERAPVPSLLAVGAVHHHLIRKGKRMRASLLVESGDAREDHHVAALLGYGASVVFPYMAMETVAELAAADALKGAASTSEEEAKSLAELSVEEALVNYRSALEDGLMRIMSKMGISTVDSYRGAQIFEAIGLADEVVSEVFEGTASRLPTVGWEALGRDALAWHASAFGGPIAWKRGSPLTRSGAYGSVKDGEYHSLNPPVFNKLRASSVKAAEAAAEDGSAESFAKAHAGYEAYASEADGRPLTFVRDALQADPLPSGPVPIEEVEDAVSIARRFSTQAMSHGSIGREAHEALAIAANKLGSRSNTGEGGEDPRRHRPYSRDMPEVSLSESWHPVAGDLGNSKIKQIASARFGVTPSYLAHAEQLEIKMAQGSKPGEGGHIPGHKVNAEIAKNRHSVEGVTLISPPPHHDIYSIEDLAQLIYDLKRVNQRAEVIVKLVSTTGVGTIAAGVAKGHADYIQISGNDGGTGASPLSSIKHAGLPWELGLAETHQVLAQNGLRDRVRLRVDGGLKTGRDVVMGALLGAEEFGFGTSALVALGCVMARKCHLNTCPVGIATQDPELRKRFKGHPDHVVSFLLHTAEQTRQELARLGFRSLDEAVGRADLLSGRSDAAFPKGTMDVSALLTRATAPEGCDTRCTRPAGQRNEPQAKLGIAGDLRDPTYLDEVVWRTIEPSIDGLVAAHGTGLDRGPVGNAAAAASAAASAPAGHDAATAAASRVVSGGSLSDLHFPIANASRSVGARLAGELASRTGDAGLPPGTLTLHFHGIAGQSFGAFCHRGMRLVLRGEAHDYVCKSMFGGEVVIAPQEDAVGRAALLARAGSELATKAKASQTPGQATAEAAGLPKTSVIAGNTVLYGATGGRFFAAGMAGQRFAVRNSGAVAVVEGAGDHCCEYMTGGTVVVLGGTGRNFGAGMSGGCAFVLDHQDSFLDRYNTGMVEPVRIEPGSDEAADLRTLIEEHVANTGSARGCVILERFDEFLPLFWRVEPNTEPLSRQSQAMAHVPNWSSRSFALERAGGGRASAGALDVPALIAAAEAEAERA